MKRNKHMPFLDDLKKKMSAQGADRYSEERFQNARPNVAQQETQTQTADLIPPVMLNVEELAKKRRRRIYLGLSITAGVVLASFLTYWLVGIYRKNNFVDQKSIGIEIKAADTVPSGENAVVTLAMRNNSNVIWRDVLLELETPEGFSLDKAEPKQSGTENKLSWGVGILRPRESVNFKLSGRLVGRVNSMATFTADAVVTPENAPDKKVKKRQFLSLGIDESPVRINIIAPKQAASGERMQVKVLYKNYKNTDVKNVRIGVEPPEGFILESALPAVNGNTLVWDFPIITQQSEGEIIFHGTIQGDPEIVRTFKAALGFIGGDGKLLAQDDVQATTVIARRALTITQVFNNQRDVLKVNPSDTVEAKVYVKNTGDIGLRDLIVKTDLAGIGVNQTSMESQGGFYDSRLNVLTWTAASIPGLKALRPGEQTELSYKFRMTDAVKLPFAKAEDNNFSVSVQTSVDSPDIPTPIGGSKIITSGKFQIMLNSVLAADIAAYYDDGRTGLPLGVGPLPPRVSKETIYTVRVRVKNTSNDVVDGVYRAVLPEGIRWVNNKYTTTGKDTFNERSREIRWDIGIIPARSGTGLPAPEFAFQVGLTPSLNQLDSRPVLVLGGSLEGTDSFTANRLRADGTAITTENADEERSAVAR